MKKIKIVTSFVIAGTIVAGVPLTSSAHGMDRYPSYENKKHFVENMSNQEIYNWTSWMNQIWNNYNQQISKQVNNKPQQNQSQTISSQPPVPHTPQPTEVAPSEVEKSETTYTLSQFEQEVVSLTNNERAKNGLKPLQIDHSLSKVARAKSQDMNQKGYFSHTSPTYGSPFDMMKQFRIQYRTAGENIAMGQQSPKEVVTAWMNSEGHRKNILSPSFTHIGVGYTSSGNYWTQMFIGK